MLNNRTLRELRIANGYSQAAVARSAGITREYIAELESGARRNPKLETLARIAGALGVGIDALVGKGR
jgi:transcriptional regulator with XRE-family HTH domain